MSRRRAFLISALLAIPAAARAGMRTEEVWIPMKDGVRLACTLYRPDTPKPGRLPVIFEYLPYRKDDGTLASDYPLYAYMVAHGYVGARVDVRGTGRSEGQVPEREYSEREQLDGVEVIAWLARQEWSSGSVGMWGWSWGGFNAIQIAARRPPGLKAILPGEATEDLFQDDIHFIDGLFHADEYELSMEVQPAITRFPDFPLDEKSLAERFDAAPWSLLYKKQQRDGPFWQVSLFPARYDRIEVPVLMIGGWYDGYRDSIPRMLEKLKAPAWAILGPWNHSGPDSGRPGPPIEWRREAVRFFDQFLKGKDTGFSKQPRLAVYVRHSYPPGADRETIPGEWRYEEGWPIRRSKETTLHLMPDRTLAAAAAPQSAAHALAYVPSSGEAAGFWWGELTPDQRSADAWSLVYDSGPLSEDLEILGFPKALLRGSANAPLANWFARLSDVAPDGEVTLVTGAGLSGAQRESASRPSPLERGRTYPFDVEMHFTSWVFPKGHRVRLAVSNALWPMIWPTPYAMTTQLSLGGADGSRLVLPMIPREARPAPDFAAPEPSTEAADVHSTGGAWPGQWTICRDEIRQAAHGDWSGTSSTQYPWGSVASSEAMTYDVADAHPESARTAGDAETTIRLPDRTLSWRAHLEVTSDAASFHYKLERQLRKDGVLLREKSWDETIPRDNQ